jgi:ACS family hexuronate transporter-like MFS transporter
MTSKTERFRYRILALVFMATTINYFDRSIVGVMAPTLQKMFEWSNKDYAAIMVSFKIAYGLGLLFMGGFIDRIGTRLGYTISIAVWSISGMLHAAIRPAFSLIGFIAARFGLGIGESGNFPAAIKTVAEWFPKKERALATGIFNSGTNIGAIVAPIAVPAIVMACGWQAAFIITGAIGFLWIIFWFIYYEIPQRQKRVKAEEIEYINSDVDEQNESGEKVPWTKLLKYRQTWIFFIGKGLTDPIWWFYLFWIPGWLATVRGTGLDLKSFGLPLVVIYTSTTVGSIFGGWLSSFMIRKGMSPFNARKYTMLIFALLVIPIMFAQYPGISTWTAVGLIALAASSHQAWSANIFTTVSDAFPKKAVSSVTGIGGMAGGLGGLGISYLAGAVLNYYKNQGHIETGYVVMFVVAGSMYIIAWTLMNVFAPKNKNVVLD